MRGFHEKKWDSKTYHFAQLVIRLGNVRCTGSGFNCILHHDGFSWRVTCAHNLIADSLGSSKVFDKILMYKCREGVNSYERKYKLDPTTVRIHPRYGGSPETGFDIGMCKITKAVGTKNWKKISFPIRKDAF